jgi:hypothetical protein
MLLMNQLDCGLEGLQVKLDSAQVPKASGSIVAWRKG